MEESSSDSDGENQDIFVKTLCGYYSELEESKRESVESFEFLKKALDSKSCLICLCSIKKNEAVWSCRLCYTLFHLMCIQQWAKDGVVVANTILSQDFFPGIVMQWTCPKCRVEYDKMNIPSVYRCFCGKQINPPSDPWLLAHSCGNVCGQDLISSCGHKCLSLCHPGQCPPCPKTVYSSCYCEQSLSKAQRCGFTGWSCGRMCRRTLSCGLHTCEQVCHEGPCLPCPEKVMQTCVCGREVREQSCDQPKWSCDQICGKPLSCQHHWCQQVCHSNSCGNCPKTGERSCPCGKKKYSVLECTVELPCCGDTCSKALDCGRHQCVRMCHLGECGPCLQSYEKLCRCGQKRKSLPCNQEYLCDSRCQQIRQCGRHQCRKKCCAGNCLPCEQLCSRLLTCKNHKCASPCHSGQCYPCVLTVPVSCACGKTSISVPCGKQRTTKAPRCSQPCCLPSSCHHIQSVHRCHFGKCPPCKQTCSLPLNCNHLCTAQCHSQPVHLPQGKPVAPWKKVEPLLVVVPCPPCKQPVSKACYGGHVMQQFACSNIADYSCARSCGHVLKCGNHTCKQTCHVVINARDATSAGDDCSTCEQPCKRSRHPECKHLCPLPCHSGTCLPCETTLKLSCHCSNINIYINCSDWCAADNKSRNIMRTCNSQCPKMLHCGHQCSQSCHFGPCTSTDHCRRKITVRCPCHRLKKEWKCNEQKVLTCNEECLSIKQKQREAVNIAADEATTLKKKEEEAAIAHIERQLRPRKRKKKILNVHGGLQDHTFRKNKFLKIIFIISCFLLLLLFAFKLITL